MKDSSVPGRKVELHSLVAKPHLNGTRGVVTGPETPSGRVPVRVEGEEATQALKYTNLRWDVGEESVPAAPVCGGRLVEEDGRCLSGLLDMGRFVVNDNFHEAVKGLEWGGDGMHRLRETPEGLQARILKSAPSGASEAFGITFSNCARALTFEMVKCTRALTCENVCYALQKLKLLTSQMYSFWTRANGTPVLGLLRNWVDESCAAAAGPRAAQSQREVTGRRKLLSGPLDRLREAINNREVAKWGDQDARITGDFWVVEQRDDGAVLVSTSESGLVCVALGIADSITKVLPLTSYENPVCVHLTLIPFQRRLVYDGIVLARPPQLRTDTAAPAAADLRARVCAAEATGALVRSMPLPEPETQRERQRIQTGAAHTAHKSADQTHLSAQEQQLVAQLAPLSSLPTPASPSAPQPGTWVMRRMDYTEAGNPNHMGVIMSGAGMMLGPFFCAALEPTAEVSCLVWMRLVCSPPVTLVP